jgi:hypothetical protein
MRDWVDRMKALGATIDGEGLIAHLAPGEPELAACYALGKQLAG